MILETPEDREREAKLAARIGAAWGWIMWPTPTLWPFDYVAERPDGRTCLWEIKCRNARWDPYHVSAAKVGRILAIAWAHDSPAFLAVDFPNTAQWVQLTNGTGKLTCGGRVDRGTPELESMVAIPLDQFTDVP